MKRILPLLVCLAWPAAAQPPAATASCQTCHGPVGNSSSPDVPRLNGQDADYLGARLMGLLNKTEQSSHTAQVMGPRAGTLRDDTRREIAGFYARQTPFSANLPAGVSAGRVLYEQGLPALGMPSCQSCHGTRGEGGAGVPRLSGQHRDYLATQLWVFNFVLRKHGDMNHAAMKLMPDQINALALYLSGG